MGDTLLAVTVLAFAVIPGLMVAWPTARRTTGLFFPGIASLLVPRRWRISWRRHREKRPDVPLRLRLALLAADRRRCVHCRGRHELQLDHIRPWALGGTTSPFNLAVLCGECNRTKSNYWPSLGARGYRPFPGHDDIRAARAILRSERLCRLSPRRWGRLVRAGLA